MRKTLFSILAFIAKNCPNYNPKYLFFTVYESIIFLMAFSVNPGDHSFVVNRSPCDDGQGSRAGVANKTVSVGQYFCSLS